MFNDLERIMQVQSNSNYPPHNVIKTGDDTVTIEVAVAGFREGEIDISLDKRVLTISGAKKTEENTDWDYLHRGISSRDFRQNFTLAEHVEVRSASIRDGILSVNLERVIPEEARPKSIAITYQN
jgi:molecular chaperone IbpA